LIVIAVHEFERPDQAVEQSLSSFSSVKKFNESLLAINQSCSMYKITAGGKAMVGRNQDAWRTTMSIWFENAGNIKP